VPYERRYCNAKSDLEIFILRNVIMIIIVLIVFYNFRRERASGFSHSLIHSFTYFSCSITPAAHSASLTPLAHISFACSLQSVAHSFTQLLNHSITHSLTHSITQAVKVTSHVFFTERISQSIKSVSRFLCAELNFLCLIQHKKSATYSIITHKKHVFF